MANIKKVKNTADKIKEISAKFSAADEIIEASEEIEEVATEIIDKQEFYAPSDVMSLEVMAEDFKFSRETLKESISYGRKVLENATLKLLLEDNEKSDNTLAFAELTTAVLNGIKVHSQLYKDFSIVLLNIKKVIKDDAPKNVTNNLNIENTENISTVDLIARLKESNED